MLSVKIFKFLILVILFSLIHNSCQGDAPIVEISTGKLKGEDKESRLDRVFYAYRGIPYAKPPIGELRFEPPQKPDSWTGVKDAEEYGDKCIQYSAFDKKVVGSENCLYINVFVPKIDNGFSKKLLPVMVFIHGGSFMHGTADIYRAHYFMDEDIIIVTFNYRLASFGFLSTGDDTVAGNMGLKDQVMALEWVRDNIRKFSGDPLKVTIFGQDAGASSVHFLLLSPMGQGLFRKAISQSGNALKISSLQTKPKLAAQRLGRLLNCEKILNENSAGNDTYKGDCLWENSETLVKCLKLADPKKIAEIHKEAFEPLRNPLSLFGPVVEKGSNLFTNDTYFLTEHPYSVIISGRQKRVPWMVGMNAQEGLVTTGVILNVQPIIDKIETQWTEMSPQFLNYHASRTDTTNQIRRFYLMSAPQQNSEVSAKVTTPLNMNMNTSSIPSIQISSSTTTTTTTTPNPASLIAEQESINFGEQFMKFTNLFTDRYYTSSMFESIQIQSKYSPVYAYYNTYEGQYTLLDVFTGKSKEPTSTYRKAKTWFKTKVLGRQVEIPKHLGVCNGDELPLLFKYPELKIKNTALDFQMSKDLVKLWVQFSYDETKMAFRNSTWLPIQTSRQNAGQVNVMRFGNSANETGHMVTDNEFTARINFWSSLRYLPPFDQ